MKFKRIAEIAKDENVGKCVSVRGWIYRTRSSKKMVFIVLRDSTGIIQCTIPFGAPFFEKAEKLLIESSVALSGKLKKDPRAPGGYEIAVDDLKVIGAADVFPITKDQSVELLLDQRHLWIRSQMLTNVFKIRSTVFCAIHEYFRKNGYYETHAPILTPTACESGADLFEVSYFGRKIYLNQSWQLYAETMIPVLEKIYTVTPAFRAEKSRTLRHLTEYWTAEAEQAWTDLDGIIKVAEELVSHICQRAGKENEKELRALKQDPAQLQRIKQPFPRITYDEALHILEKDGMKVEWGKDLRTFEERQLASHYEKPVVVTEYPKEVMAFYKPPRLGNEKVALCFDVIAPAGFEIIGGSERDTNAERMREWLQKKGEKVESYWWYLDMCRYGAVPHAGFGLGIERVIQWICGLEHIRDAIPFPRTIDRCYP